MGDDFSYSFSYSYGTYDPYSGFNSVGGSGYAGQNVTYQATTASQFDAFTSNPFVTNTTTTGYTLDASIVGASNYQIGVDYTNNAVTGFANPNTGGTAALSLDNTYYTILNGSDAYLTTQFNLFGSIVTIQTLTATTIANTIGIGPNDTYVVNDTNTNVVTTTGTTTFDPNVDFTPTNTNFSVNIAIQGDLVVSAVDYRSAITAYFNELKNGIPATISESVEGALTVTQAFQTGSTTLRVIGPGIDVYNNEAQIAIDVAGRTQSYYDRIQEIAFAQSQSDPAFASLVKPADFGFNLATETFASNEDAELYGLAVQQRIADVITSGLTNLDSALAIVQQLVAQNPEYFATATVAATGETYYTLKSLFEINQTLEEVSQDPAAIQAIRSIVAAAGGDVSNADLRASTLTLVIDAQGFDKNAEIVSPATQSIINQRVAGYISQTGSGISADKYAQIRREVISSTATQTGPAAVSNADVAAVSAGGGGGLGEALFADANLVDVDVATDINLLTIDQGDTAIQTVEVTANTSVSKAIRDSLGLPNQGPIIEKLIEKAINLGLNQIPGYSQINSVIGTANKVIKLEDIATNVDLSPAETALALAKLVIPQVNLLVNGYNLLTGGGGGGGGGGLGEALFADANLVDVAPVGNFAVEYNVETGTYDVVDIDTGEVLFSGLSQETAARVADALSIGDDGGALDIIAEAENDAQLNTGPDDVTIDNDPNLYPNGPPYDDNGNLNPGWAINPETGEPYYTGIFGNTGAFENVDSQESVTLAKTKLAQNQAAIEAQRKQANEGDWRVKLRLAPGADYLYKDPGISSDGILYPLSVTDGVVFPYTPVINTVYAANYSTYDLTHSNYRGHFYQNSYVDDIQLQATFTAQDTNEANYMLAVIHFFRSVTKMFYGQDAQRGTPPPMVFLQGLGEFQFNLHPCLVKSFSYNLPGDVDYIRARTVEINGTNLLQKRNRQTLSTSSSFASLIRLANAGVTGLQPGAITTPPPPPTLGTNNPTYVPTKIDISLVLLPVQSRSQVSKQFSLKSFANGDLLKGGFW